MTPCPNCGHSEDAPALQATPQTKSRDLARVASAAEAGYLIHLLQGVGLRAESRPVESFDAVLGSWSTSFLVAVDERDAADATRILQAEAEEGFAEAFSGKLNAQSSAPVAESAMSPWRVLAVLAAVAATGAAFSFDGFDRAPRAPRVRVEPASRLLEALAADPTPLRTEGLPGGPRRQLLLDRTSGLWELSIDADRDGRYETTRRFAAPAVGR